MRDVTVSGLGKTFGAHVVLAGLDLEVPAGSLTAILGPSGSGKTTLLRLLAGFERADTGTIGIGGVLVDGPGAYLPPERRRIGYVPQEGSLFPHLTVAGNVGFGLPAGQRRGGKVDGLLETVGLGGFGRRYPHQLSGGQQQRVALARALAIEPAVVLLDEPFASLDAHLRASVRADVQEIFRRAGTTAVLVTHDQDEALSVADRVAALRDGGIAQCAPPEDLYCRPADPRLASFIGEANLLEGVVSGATVKTLLGALPLDPAAAIPGAAGQVTVLIRPEQIDIVPNGDGLTAQVTSYRYHGHDAVLYAQPEDDAAVAGSSPVVVRIAGGPHRPVGSGVTLRARGPVFAWPAVSAPLPPCGRVCDGVPLLTGLPVLSGSYRAGSGMRTRGRLTVRVCGLLAAVTLAATLLGAVAPARAAAVVSSSGAGPSGVAAWSAAVENAATGKLLWSRGLNTERPMASITKVMTAYLVIRAGHLDRKITIPAAVTGYVRAHNASSAGLRPGDRLTARQLLYALLLPSGADAAYTLAKAYGPGLSRFVTRMNATARLLGMRRTHFSNFDGLPYPTSYSNYSTAANLLVLGRAAMRLPVFRSVVAKRSYGLAAGSGHHAYRWKNLNPLLGRYPGAIGIKPGYTGAAGQCLLFEATRHGHTVIGVTLHSPGSISSVNPADATRILNWAFSHLS